MKSKELRILMDGHIVKGWYAGSHILAMLESQRSCCTRSESIEEELVG